MDTVIIAFSAMLASCLTLFSGFGLGTLLMPVIAIFFPVELAISMTAVVHLANNVFKLSLMGKQANRDVAIRFGVPAILASFLGAGLLVFLSSLQPLFSYSIMGNELQVMPVKLIIGIVIVLFTLLELSPSFEDIKFERRFLPLGGLISGFFGGLSGNQGAFRSMFLIKAGLSKEQFVATGIVLAVMVDLARIPVYGFDVLVSHENLDWQLVIIATASAFIGAFAGARLIKKVTIRSIQTVVSVLLIIVGLGMIMGVL